MSGGSYNYLCFEQFPELIERTEDMNEIQLRLRQLGAHDIADDVDELIKYCREAHEKIEPLFEKLSGVFHAIEWLDSGDIGKDGVKEEFKRYRNEKRNDQHSPEVV